MSIRILILILILFGIDLYVFQGIKLLIQHKSLSVQRAVSISYWIVSFLCITVVLLAQFTEWRSWPKLIRTYSFAVIVIIYLSKIFVTVFMLLDDIVRLFRLLAAWIAIRFGSSPVKPDGSSALQISRLNFLVKLGFIAGSIPFFSMIYGMMGGATRYQVRNIKLKSPRFPQAMNGLRIVQLSDIHIGSFMSEEPLERAIDLVLKQKPDLILFTGDLVNDRHDEAVPYQHLLRKLQAPLGVYSVLGNHDYGDYYRWPSIESKAENLAKLKNFHGEVGWKLLLNDHLTVKHEGTEFNIVGVENWSARRAFQHYGDMPKATRGINSENFTVLMSHDPSHWNAEVTKHYPYVDLTLSGHTHGFQYGVEIPGFKWSPVQYMYKEWADLYSSGAQNLYVNRGLGFIGYPGRVGILPEITVFELSNG